MDNISGYQSTGRVTAQGEEATLRSERIQPRICGMGVWRISQTPAGYARDHCNIKLSKEPFSINRRGKQVSISANRHFSSRIVWRCSHGVHIIGLHCSLFLLLGISYIWHIRVCGSHAKAIDRNFLALRLCRSANRKLVLRI